MLTVTADNLPRIMQCTGSLYMQPETLPESLNPVRQEGIAAHWVIEQCYRTGQSPETYTDRQAENGVFISGEMVEHVEGFLASSHPNDQVEVSGYIGNEVNWRVNCRADRQRLVDGVLYTDEFKYGFSIIEPEMNWTLLAHAFRYVMEGNPQPERYVFTVYQPRPYHPKGAIRSWEISRQELGELFEQLNKRLSNPENVLTTGNACRNCPALHSCPAAKQAAMNVVDVSLHAYTDNIGNDDLSAFLDTLDRAAKMLKQTQKAYEELAKHRLKSGQILPNYGLQNEMTNRKWHDYVTVDFALAMTGKDLSKKALITPAQAEKLGVSPEIMKLLADRHVSGVKLARIDENDKAKKLFNPPK